MANYLTILSNHCVRGAQLSGQSCDRRRLEAQGYPELKLPISPR